LGHIRRGSPAYYPLNPHLVPREPPEPLPLHQSHTGVIEGFEL
jgi:hypothetical protein